MRGGRARSRDGLKLGGDARKQLAVLTPWLKAREAEGLDEGSAEATAVLAALKKIEPLKRLFG